MLKNALMSIAGERIKEVRLKKTPKKWSMADLAAELAEVGALGLDKDKWLSRIKNYETNRTELGEPEIGHIAAALGVAEEWFSSESETPIRWTRMPSNAVAIQQPKLPMLNLVPYWGLVPCGNWERPEIDENEPLIEVSDNVGDTTGVVAVRVAGNSMLPVFRPNQVVSIRLDSTALDGVITLARNQDNELTLKKLAYVAGAWELHSLNPDYGITSAESWEILGHAIYAEGGDPSGMRG